MCLDSLPFHAPNIRIFFKKTSFKLLFALSKEICEPQTSPEQSGFFGIQGWEENSLEYGETWIDKALKIYPDQPTSRGRGIESIRLLPGGQVSLPLRPAEQECGNN